MLGHIAFVTSVWYVQALATLSAICLFLHVPVSMGLVGYLLFQDLWFYMYHRLGHHLFGTYQQYIPLFWTLHYRHHSGKNRTEWLAFVLNYVPIELAGCALYASIIPVDPVVMTLMCLSLSVCGHLIVHSFIHMTSVKQTTNQTCLRIRRYHTCHHVGRVATCAFSAGSLLGDHIFGTVPPVSRWY
jgi:sterol desaturase/sphingolipid hydroxylase (fatty acid hydroxylase superfamily)